MANWFIAVPFEVLGELALPPGPPGLRALHRDDLHLTVAFLGACGEPAALRAWAALATRLDVAPLPGFEVSLGPAGPLGPAGRFSVIAVRLDDGAERAQALVEGLRDELCDAAGVRRELRPALPHVTLARIDRRARRSERQLALTWAAGLELRRVRARLGRIALFTSAHGERRYRVVVQRALGGAPLGAAPQTGTGSQSCDPA